MSKNKKIDIEGSAIAVIKNNGDDYISLTDLAKHKNAEHTGVVISHWMSTRYTIEFMGIWERVNNPDFNITEFRYIRNESGSNGFVLSTKQWIEKTHAIGILAKAGRYGGTYAQLVVLSNLESINAMLIQQGLNQSQRITQLNAMAISQMRSLLTLDDTRNRLETAND